MNKLAWVLVPLLLVALAAAVLAWRGRLPGRAVLNAWSSLLLLVYLGATAGLGIFWVANQHLPVFDWHYVFGYATLLLLAVHLAYNLRALWAHLRRRPVVQPVGVGRRPVAGALALAQLASFAVVLLSFSPFVALLLFGASVPLFVAQNRFSKIHFRLLTWRTPETRQMHYFERLLTDKESIKEVKLFGLGDFLLRRYDALFWKFYGEDARLARRRSVTSLLFGLLASAAYYGAYAWVVWRAVIGQATLGDMTLYLALFRQSQTSFLGLLKQINDLYESSLFMSNLYDYLEMQPSLPVAAHPRKVAANVAHTVEFERVSFRYPNKPGWALRDISLKIRAGEKLALVGENGAGKTTFIKLLTRLYDPTEGRILLDGVDLRA